MTAPDATPRTKRECLDAVIADLNLDVRDPFTNLLANALALFDQQQEERRATLRHIEARANLTQQILRLESANAQLRAAYYKLDSALSRIDYALGEPNEMECSPYDVHKNEDAVIDGVKKLRAELAGARACINAIADDCCPLPIDGVRMLAAGCIASGKCGCALGKHAPAISAARQEGT